MSNEKDDRRVRYTKMVLKESFIKLLTQKDISQITIKEICEDADINRATFYAHYSDQYDLMRKMENELMENVALHLAAYTQNDKDVDHIGMVEEIFDYIKENAELCKLLLSERGDLNFQKRVMSLVNDKYISDLTSSGVIAKEDAEYVHAFIITGCVGAIQKWLLDDMKKSSHLMAEIVVKLSVGLTSLISQKLF